MSFFVYGSMELDTSACPKKQPSTLSAVAVNTAGSTKNSKLSNVAAGSLKWLTALPNPSWVVSNRRAQRA